MYAHPLLAYAFYVTGFTTLPLKNILQLDLPFYQVYFKIILGKWNFQS